MWYWMLTLHKLCTCADNRNYCRYICGICLRCFMYQAISLFYNQKFHHVCIGSEFALISHHERLWEKLCKLLMDLDKFLSSCYKSFWIHEGNPFLAWAAKWFFPLKQMKTNKLRRCSSFAQRRTLYTIGIRYPNALVSHRWFQRKQTIFWKLWWVHVCLLWESDRTAQIISVSSNPKTWLAFACIPRYEVQRLVKYYWEDETLTYYELKHRFWRQACCWSIFKVL